MYSVEMLEALTKTYGNPLYVFNSNEFEENYKKFVGCFQSIYPSYRLAYSYKTNYTPAICQLVKKLGGYAEVVSDMEYSLAKKIGYSNDKIIYNGPCKGELAKEHLINGGIINIDSFDELAQICDFAKENTESHFNIGVRLNIEVGQPFISRFGIDISKENLEQLRSVISDTPNLSLVGLHCHVSQARAVESWQKRTETILWVADELFETVPEYLDLGSGMYGQMVDCFKEQFSNVASYEEYADVTARIVAEHYSDFDKKPILFTEPGTTVVNKYMDFITKVVSIKKIKGKTFVVVNGSSHNIGEICKLKKLPICIVGKHDKTTMQENADIVGYTCLEHDVLYSGFSGEISVGDYIIFGNVGGYSNVSKPPFIHPNCTMIELDKHNNAKLIKKAETIEDIFSTYVF